MKIEADVFLMCRLETQTTRAGDWLNSILPLQAQLPVSTPFDCWLIKLCMAISWTAWLFYICVAAGVRWLDPLLASLEQLLLQSYVGLLVRNSALCFLIVRGDCSCLVHSWVLLMYSALWLMQSHEYSCLLSRHCNTNIGAMMMMMMRFMLECIPVACKMHGS